MSGAATFSGTSYQAGVLAYIFVHVLRQSPLGWFEHEFLDVPIGVLGETDGPGDDVRIEFGERHVPIEVQAKHGLTGGAKLSEAVGSIASRSAAANVMDVVLVVDRSSSRTVRRDFAGDLDRHRVGRTDRLGVEITRLLAEIEDGANVLRRLRVVTVDIDRTSDPERRVVCGWLADMLVDARQAEAAWSVLTQDAAEVCARRQRRTRQDLIGILSAKGFELRPAEEDAAAMQQLDFSKRLLDRGKGGVVLSYLELIEADLKGGNASNRVWHRLHQHRATALLLLHRPSEALASARQALAADSASIPALLTAAHAAIESGDLDAARAYLDSVLKLDPSKPEAWSARIQLDVMAGTTPADPPGDVKNSPSYQFALAQIAMNSGDLAQVVALARPLVATGHDDPSIVLLLVTAMTAIAVRDEVREYRVEAERLATEAIEKIGDDHPLVVRFLAERAELFRLRGDKAGCEADLARARQLHHEDPNAVAQLALSQLHAGHPEQVLVTLSLTEIEHHPMLLLVRAQARLALRELERAREDLDRALPQAAGAADPDAFRLHAAELALDLKDTECAVRLLDAVSAEPKAPDMFHVLRGRVAFHRRDAAALDREFRTAAELVPSLKDRLFPELAQRLVRLGRMEDAVRAFEEIAPDAFPPELRGDYAGALLASNDLVKAAGLVSGAEDDGAPDWKLHIASEIAFRRGDLPTASRLLSRVADRHTDDLHLTFEVARRLLLMKEGAAAAPYLDRLAEHAATLDPQQRMAVAHLLKEAGRPQEAMRIAFRAFRAASQDPAMHRGLGSLLVLDPKPVEHSGAIEADTYFKLTSDTGETVHHIVYADPPVDPVRHEMLLGAAEQAGFLGKREGDWIVTDPRTWQEKRWRVSEVLPAVIYVWRDIMENYKTRFPTEPFFVQMFRMSEEPSVRDFAPIVSSLHARREQANKVFQLYRENILPLAFVGSMLGVDIVDVMSGAMTEELGPLAVEWFDGEGQEASRAAARAATKVVLTASALRTAGDLGLFEILRPLYSWVAPQSLIEALERGRAEAVKKRDAGQRTLTAGDTGLRADELPANAPSLVAAVARYAEALEWVRTNAVIEFRPLETIKPADSAEEKARERLGADSVDAVNLAEHLGAALFADDLGLRKFVTNGKRVDSFSSVSLLTVLAERGAIPPDGRDKLLLSLIDRRYLMITPTKSLLVTALEPAVPPRLSAAAFALLGGGTMPLDSAAETVAAVIRDVAVAPIRLRASADIVRLGLDGMRTRWSPKLCAHALAQAAAIQLTLLPAEVQSVRDAILAYLKTNGA